MGDQVRPKGWARNREVEVAIWAIGPFVTAQVYDAETLAPICSLSASDPKYTAGRLGFRIQAGRKSAGALRWLSIRHAGKTTGARDAPVGRRRLVHASASAVESIPGRLRYGISLFDDGSDDGRARLVTSPRHLERLVRAGFEPDGVSGEIPYYAVSARLREARARYFREAPSGLIVEPGFSVWTSYKDAEMVLALVRDYHRRFPEITELVELGRSHQGIPLLALRIGDKDSENPEPAVLLNGAHHGVELMSTDFVLDAIDTLLVGYAANEPSARRWVEGLDIWCVPLVDPDGNVAFVHRSMDSGRKNGRDSDGDGVWEESDGVDLNRNYPFRWGALGELGSSGEPRHVWYRGPAPASEPETQAMMRLADAMRFVASISYHTRATKLLAPYTIDDVPNPEPNEAWTIAEEVASAMPRQPNGRRMEVVRKLYSVDGTDQDWLRAAHGTVALLLEGAYNLVTERMHAATIEATRPSWQALFDRVLRGPALWGFVTDETGAPVVAEIRIDEVSTLAGERWTTRCRDGRFDRLVSRPGRYTVRAVTANQEIVREVKIGKRPVRVDLVLSGGGESRSSCADPTLCSVDALCAGRAGQCVEIGASAWCLEGGACRAPVEGGGPACLAPSAGEWSAHPANPPGDGPRTSQDGQGQL
jgi:hypothetical protein